MRGWKSAGIRAYLTTLELVMMIGTFLIGVGMAMFIGVKTGRSDRATADCVAYLALGIAVYLFGLYHGEKKERELKESKEAKE